MILAPNLPTFVSTTTTTLFCTLGGCRCWVPPPPPNVSLLDGVGWQSLAQHATIGLAVVVVVVVVVAWWVRWRGKRKEKRPPRPLLGTPSLSQPAATGKSRIAQRKAATVCGDK
ncbi:hypothetical protein ACJBU6_00528 [Exserohilum turcicum]